MTGWGELLYLVASAVVGALAGWLERGRQERRKNGG